VSNYATNQTAQINSRWCWSLESGDACRHMTFDCSVSINDHHQQDMESIPTSKPVEVSGQWSQVQGRGIMLAKQACDDDSHLPDPRISPAISRQFKPTQLGTQEPPAKKEPLPFPQPSDSAICLHQVAGSGSFQGSLLLAPSQLGFRGVKTSLVQGG